MGKANEKSGEKEEKPLVARNALGLQKMKLEKLMKNPDKPVIIPDRQKDKKLPHVPDFVRNVMGSSAGAGSGEFHVYRHLRRKEYARQKIIHEKGEKSNLDVEYQIKLEENKREAEARTAKKRAKRLKKKENLKKKKRLGGLNKKKDDVKESESEESSNDETDVAGDKRSDEEGAATEGNDGDDQQRTEEEDNTKSCESERDKAERNSGESDEGSHG